MFGCKVLINSENQFTFSFGILVKKFYLQEGWICFPLHLLFLLVFWLRNFIFRKDGFVFHVRMKS